MLLLLLLPPSTLEQQRPLLFPLQLPQLPHHLLSSVQPPLVGLGRVRHRLLVLHLHPHSQLHLLNLRLLGQTPMQRLYLVRPVHLFLELLLIPHQQVEDFSSEGPVRLAPQTRAQVFLPLVPVQRLLLHQLPLPSRRSQEQLLVDSISLRPQHLTSGQINHSRLLVVKPSPGAGLRQRCGGGSRALWSHGRRRLD